MLDLTYSEIVGNSKTMALAVSEVEFNSIMLELQKFLKNYLVEDVKFYFEDASGVIILTVMLSITPEAAAQLSWNFTEIMVDKELDNFNLLISLFGTIIK